MDRPSLATLLRTRFAAAIAQLTGQPCAPEDALVRPATDPRFGDYQCNAAMPLAKPLGRKPRQIAEQLAASVDLREIAERVEIAGPGFINVYLRPEYLAGYLAEIPPPPTAPEAPAGDRPEPAGDRAEPAGDRAEPAGDRAEPVGDRAEPAPPTTAWPDRVGIPRRPAAERVILDYSSPNIAKQMHVGHLRTTVIGDVFARVLSLLGHEVIRQNHVGDWGTAIGMVVVGLWYIESRLQRGESADDVAARLARLSDDEIDEQVREALGHEICAEWTADLRKSELDRFADGLSLEQLELGYRFVNKLIELAGPRGWAVTTPDGAAEELAAIPRKVTRMLQEGGAANEAERQAWRTAREISLRDCQQIYDRLGVLLTLDDVVGESFYQYEQDRLTPTLEQLRRRLPPRDRAQPLPPDGWAEMREDQGALCIFLYDGQGRPRFTTPEGDELPMIVRKSDGAFLYASTDLAAMRYRIEELRGQRLIYVTGAPQRLHFQMLFAVARAAGWLERATAEHVTFGSVLGSDRRPLKTRTGENVKLSALLDEAERRALALLEQRQRDQQAAQATRQAGDAQPHEGEPAAAALSPDEMRQIASRVGIAAVKYADLARDRNTDYVFNWDQMLALQGNTAPYMMYAYARIRSIYRRAADQFGAPDVYAPSVVIALDHPTERALALRLARFPEFVEQVAADLTPHVLCGYLYELAADFMRFYEACPVLRAPDAAARLSRMRLCDLTARTLRLGLGLLGIEVIERM